MDAFDFAALGGICCLIAAGFLFRHLRFVRLSVVFILFCVGFGSALDLSLGLPRSLFNQGPPHTTEPSEEFFEGLRVGGRFGQVHAPYLMLSTVGLTLLAVVSEKRKRSNPGPTGGGNR